MKYLCNGINCAVYVFGASTDGICPGCGEEGHRVPDRNHTEFMVWFRKVE